MIRTILATTASIATLALVAPAAAQGGHDHATGEIEFLLQGSDAETGEGDAATPTMSFGDWGVDTSLLSDSIDPGDNFFGYVNQKWLDANPLPAQYSRFGAFTLLGEKSTSDVKTLMDELAAKPESALTTDEKRLVDAYNSYFDTAAINEAGLAPAKTYLDRITAADTLEGLLTLWSTPGYPSPLGGGVDVDAVEPDRYSVYIGTGGLGMPDRDYYLDETEKGVAIQQKYRDYLAFLFTEAGYANPEETASAVYEFEETIARDVSSDRAASRDVRLIYNPFTPSELDDLAGDFPIATMIEASGFGETDRLIVTDLRPSEEKAEALGLTPEVMAKLGSGFTGMLGLLQGTPLDTLKAWTVKEMLANNSSILPTRFDQAGFEFYGKTLRGTPEQRERWKRAIDETEGMLGELLGKSYAARYFPPESKASMDDLVGNLRKALAASIDEIDWMSEDTKQQALAKLDSFDPKIGYRDNLDTYEGLAIDAGDPWGNRMNAAHWAWRDNLEKLGQPIDRTEWGMLPQTVNAYYNPLKNEIVFPAGILQQPFFAASNDIAVNYGAIGGVIGHEMGHGFDDQGSRFSATGALENWWTDEDRAAFDALGDALVEQYNAFCPLDDGETCVNGRLTLGENIGDLGGLSLAYRAYKIATDGKDLPVIDGLTGDQRFFLAWAQVWRSQQREDNYRNRLRTDTHSPEEFRTNGVVRNLDEWYKAFNVTPEDDLYLPPEERVRIW